MVYGGWENWRRMMLRPAVKNSLHQEHRSLLRRRHVTSALEGAVANALDGATVDIEQTERALLTKQDAGYIKSPENIPTGGSLSPSENLHQYLEGSKDLKQRKDVEKSMRSRITC